MVRMKNKEFFTARQWAETQEIKAQKMSIRMVQHYARLGLWFLPDGRAGQEKRGRDWLFFSGAMVKFPRKTPKTRGTRGKLGYPREKK